MDREEMDNEPSIPEEYVIYQQDLSKDYLQLRIMGVVRTISEARTMCKVFSDADGHTKDGTHSYTFICNKLKGE